MVMDWVEPNVCVDENLTTGDDGLLRFQPWSVPRNVVDVIARSSGDGTIYPTTTLPGKLLIDKPAAWTNDAPIDQMVLIRMTRAYRSWLVSSPNAVQFRDRWTHAIDRTPAEPLVTSVYQSQCGSAIDVGTNSVAEPNPGRQWMWSGCHASEEWVGPVKPGETLRVWYRCYVWTPPPWSDNANKGDPEHNASARWTRIQMIAFPQQGDLVSG